MLKNEEIKKLQEEIREIEQSKENIQRKDKWDCIPNTARDQWRGLPKTDGSCQKGIVPVQVDPNNMFWSRYFNFSIKEYFLNPETFVKNYLKISIERFKLFNDDIFVSKIVPIWMGAGYEASLFGMTIQFFDHIDPWIDYENTVIKQPEDLKKTGVPDFYKSGLMPQAIKMYERVKELLDDDFEVFFPEWLRGPFGIATYIRGFENVLMDMITDEFAHELMKFIVVSRKAWYDDQSKYLGKPFGKANMFNDEVNTPSLSPTLYEEYVLPYENELADYHGGLLYYHSCGDLSVLYENISKITGKIDMVHKGPWSDASQAAKYFGQRSAIEVVMNPQADICEGTEQTISDTLAKIVKPLHENKVKGYTLRANNIQIYDSFENSINKANMFIKAAREVVERNYLLK